MSGPYKVDDPDRYFDVQYARILDELTEERRHVDVESELGELALLCNLRGDHDQSIVIEAAAVCPEFVAEVASRARDHLRQWYEREGLFGGPDDRPTRKLTGQGLRKHIDGMLDAFDLMHPETPDEFAKHLLGFMIQTSLPGVPRRDATPEVIEDARKRVAKGVRKAFNRAEYERPTASSVGVSVLRELGVSKDIAKSVFRK